MELKKQLEEIKESIGGIVGFCSGNVVMRAAMMTLPAGKIGMIAKLATAVGSAGLAGLAANKVTEFICEAIDEHVKIETVEEDKDEAEEVVVEVINT